MHTHTRSRALTVFVRMCEFWFCASLNIINFMWAFHRDCVDLRFIFNFIIGWLHFTYTHNTHTHTLSAAHTFAPNHLKYSTKAERRWIHDKILAQVLIAVTAIPCCYEKENAPSAAHIFYSLAIHSSFLNVFFARFLLILAVFFCIIRENYE